LKKTIIYNFIFPILSAAAVIAIWAAAAAIYDKPLLLPSVSAVFADFFKMFAQKEFYAAMGTTFLRSVACYACSVFFSLILAVAAATCKFAESMLRPVIGFLRSVPVIALILIVLTAPSSFIPVFVGFLTIFPLLYSAYYDALTSEKMKEYTELCRVYRVKKRYGIRYVYAPVLLKTGFLQAYALLPLSVKIVISGEVLAYAGKGLGMLLHAAQLAPDISSLVALAFWAAILSFISQGLVKILETICKRCKVCR